MYPQISHWPLLHAAFFHRAPGRLLKVDDDQQPLVHWKLGELLGQIHNETRVYQGPRHRDHWNEERGFVLARRVQGDPKDPMTRAWREVIQWLDHLPTDIEHYGLIHGDAHQGNFFVTDQKEITLFDFDDSQLSWYAYELAIPLFSLLGREINGEENPILYEECRESLIDGYLQTQNKRPDWIDWIPKFIEFRTVLLYFWAQARYQKKDLEPDGLKRIRRMMAWCKARTLASR
ncbi:MAG: phosphotransferase [Pseudomonadota bacterium]